LNRNPKNSAKCCSERSGRKLEAHRLYGFVGRDGCPQGIWQRVCTCFMLPRQSYAESPSFLQEGAHFQALHLASLQLG